MSDKNRFQYGSVRVRIAEQVIKLGIVVDDYKLPRASELWAEAERRAVAELCHIPFDPRDLFYSDSRPYGEGHPVTCLFRYYTPIANRVRQEKP